METILSNNTLTAVINSKGAELISLKNAAGNDFIWEGNPQYWGKHSPVLFPIVGTLKGNQYRHNNQSYTLSRHGFARDMHFELISKSKSKAVFSLKTTPETKAVFPFNFELQISYSLQKNNLIVSFKVANESNEIMPFSIGAHPAFALPKPFESYSLLFEFDEKLNSYSLENDLLSDNSFKVIMHKNKLPLAYSLFENDALIFKEINSKKITLLENEIPIMNFHFNDFKNFGIWTKVNAPFICLEPWLGYSDKVDASGNLIEKEAIQLLAATSVFECQYRMEMI